MTTFNPYSTPTAGLSQTGSDQTVDRSPNREYLRRVAAAQRSVNFSILVYLLTIGGNFVLMPVLGEVVRVITMIIIIVVALTYIGVSVFRLAALVRGRDVAIFYVLGIILPIPGIFVVFLLSVKASSILRDHGVEVGLLGANLDQF